MADIDEIALNTLLAEGVDPATAYAASIKEPQTQRPSRKASRVLIAGAICGAIFALILRSWLW
jgi:hypothetical protein